MREFWFWVAIVTMIIVCIMLLSFAILHTNVQIKKVDALLLRFQDDTGAYNRVFLRGLPDSLIDGEVFNSTDPTWLPRYNVYKAILETTGNFAISSNRNNLNVPIINSTLAKNSPKGILASLPVGSSLEVGTQVRVSGASIPGYNGVHNVNVALGNVGPNPTYILGAGRMIADNPHGDQVLLHKLEPAFVEDFTVNIEQFTLRKAGRPFGQRRGRARTLLNQRP